MKNEILEKAINLEIKELKEKIRYYEFKAKNDKIDGWFYKEQLKLLRDWLASIVFISIFNANAKSSKLIIITPYNFLFVYLL